MVLNSHYDFSRKNAVGPLIFSESTAFCYSWAGGTSDVQYIHFVALISISAIQ